MTSLHENQEPTELNQGELGTDAELYAEQQPLVVEYDPSRVVEFPVEQMSKIEKEIAAARDAGQTDPTVLQTIANVRLEQMGFDPSAIASGIVVGEVTSPDGKKEVRAIVVDHNDFGTRIRNVELHEVRLPEVVDEMTEEQKAEAEIDRKVQEQAIKTLMNDIFDSSRKIEQQSEANKNERAKSQQDIGEFINETKKLVNAFGYGKPVDQDMIRRLAEQLAPDAAAVMQQNANYIGEEQVEIHKFSTGLEESASQTSKKLDEPHAEKLSTVLSPVANSVKSFVSAADRAGQHAEHGSQTMGNLVRCFGDFASSSYGHEELIDAIAGLINTLERSLYDQGQLSQTKMELLQAIKQQAAQFQPKL